MAKPFSFDDYPDAPSKEFSWDDYPDDPESKTLWDKASDFAGSVTQNAVDMIPGKGIVDKIGEGSYAAQQKLADLFRDEKDQHTFDDYRQEARKLVQRQQAHDREAGGALPKVIGQGAGMVIGTALMPTGGATAAGRIATNVGISAIDEGTRGEKLFDADRAKHGAQVAGVLSAGGESVAKIAGKLAETPAGKAMLAKGVDLAEWVRNKVGHAGFGVPEASTEAYLANPERMRETIAAGDNKLEQLKNQVDELHSSKVSEPLERAKEAAAAAKDSYKDDIATLRNTRPPEALVPDIIGKTQEADKELTKLSGENFDKLKDTSFDRFGLADKVDEMRSKLLIDGRAPVAGDDLAAYNALSKVDEMIKPSPELYRSTMDNQYKTGDLKATDVKRILQTLDDMSASAYDTYGTRTAAGKIAAIRRELDGTLKAAVPDYAKAMEPLAEKTRLVSALKSIFGDEESARAALLKAANPDTGGPIRSLLKELDDIHGTDFSGQLNGYISAQKILKDPEAKLAYERAALGGSQDELAKAKDAASFYSRVGPGSTENTIKSVSRGKNLEAQKQLEMLGGDGLMTSIDEYGKAQPFIKTKESGSRRAAIGGTIGAALGGAPGAAIGATAGGLLDKQGGKLWQKILDGQLKAKELAKDMAPEFKRALEAAEKRGPRALASAYYIILQKQEQK